MASSALSAIGCPDNDYFNRPLARLLLAEGDMDAVNRLKAMVRDHDLILCARKKSRFKHGGKVNRVDLTERALETDDRNEEIVAIDEVLTQLEHHDQQAALLVKLRYFVGMEHQEAAHVLGISRRAADRVWLLGRTWLARALRESCGRNQL